MMTVRLRVILITPARKDAAPISAYVPVYTSPNAALSTGPESQKCLALSTHRGVLLQLRLPFGSSSAPAYFQELIDQLTSDLKGVAVYIHVDDILVSVVSAVEHFENLRVLMQRLQDKGIRYRQENRRWSRISKFYVYSLWVFVVWIQGGDPTESARSSSTDILQLGHFGVQRMKQLACTAVY
ncbi:hypothetical protein EMCRGX_G016927 [Ephydatia muelleri]